MPTLICKLDREAYWTGQASKPNGGGFWESWNLTSKPKLRNQWNIEGSLDYDDRRLRTGIQTMMTKIPWEGYTDKMVVETPASVRTTR